MLRGVHGGPRRQLSPGPASKYATKPRPGRRLAKQGAKAASKRLEAGESVRTPEVVEASGVDRSGVPGQGGVPVCLLCSGVTSQH